MATTEYHILRNSICQAFCRRDPNADNKTKEILCQGCAVREMDTNLGLPFKEIFKNYEPVKHVRFTRSF